MSKGPHQSPPACVLPRMRLVCKLKQNMMKRNTGTYFTSIYHSLMNGVNTLTDNKNTMHSLTEPEPQAH